MILLLLSYSDTFWLRAAINIAFIKVGFGGTHLYFSCLVALEQTTKNKYRHIAFYCLKHLCFIHLNFKRTSFVLKNVSKTLLTHSQRVKIMLWKVYSRFSIFNASIIIFIYVILNKILWICISFHLTAYIYRYKTKCKITVYSFIFYIFCTQLKEDVSILSRISSKRLSFMAKAHLICF